MQVEIKANYYLQQEQTVKGKREYYHDTTWDCQGNCMVTMT